MRRARDDSGVTVTELLVFVVLLGIVLVTVYVLMGAVTSMTNSTSARAIAADESQKAIARMSREIREAQENNMNGKGVVYLAGANDLQIFVNTNKDAKPELVRYYRATTGGVTSLYRTVKLASNTTTPTPPDEEWTFTGAASTPELIATNLVTTSDLFCYHERVYSATVVCPNDQRHLSAVPATVSNPYTTALPKISMIGINLINSYTEGNQTAKITADVLTRIRSIDNNTN